ncbi:MAG: hypothetical protein HY460_00830, partial [Parcubacteria group bacterium]|nr:hypothetical protein [Parcubacteria group bacterium]
MEFLIYLGIIAVVMTAVVGISQSFFDAKLRSRSVGEVGSAAQSALQRIGSAAQRAKDIEAGSLVGVNLATGGGFVGFILDDAGENPTRFSVQNGILAISEGAFGNNPLT